MDKAKEILADLKIRFFQGNLLRISNLQMEASSLKQRDLSVTDFFTKLRTILDELDNFRPDLTFNYSTKYSYQMASQIAQNKIEDQFMQLLRGLNGQYRNIRSHVLLMEPIPLISKFSPLSLNQKGTSLEKFLYMNLKINIATRNSCTFCGQNGHSD
ncbi:hypothetical protein V8G54_023739 [Vigna mungo]|uniref:Retrotransposon gag domain-containing protein n=1 Tax=Vigna mungo TaxID=3915 RepID=A0AAQ3N4A6_VIGMU